MKRKIKDGLIYFSVCLAGIVLCLCASGIGEGAFWPCVIGGVCASWIGLFFWANKEGGAE